MRDLHRPTLSRLSPDGTPVAASLVCLRRSEDGKRIEKVGVEIDGVLKHYAPAGIFFALKVGAWRLRYVPAFGAGIDVSVGVGPEGEEVLLAGGNRLAGDDGLADVPQCTHRSPSGSFEVPR